MALLFWQDNSFTSQNSSSKEIFPEVSHGHSQSLSAACCPVGASFSLAIEAVEDDASRPDRTAVGLQPDGSFLVSTNQAVTPIGTVRRLEGARAKDLALSPDGKSLAVLATNRVAFFGTDGTSRGNVPLSAGAIGIVWSPDGHMVFASGNSDHSVP